MNSISRPILRFFGAFLMLYVVLIGLSLVPGIGSASNHLYCKTTQPVLESLLSKAFIQMKADPSSNKFIRIDYASKAKVQQQMAEASRTGKKQMNVEGRQKTVDFYNIFLNFWLLFLALMLVSPLPWKAKTIRILLGSLIFYGYSVCKLYLSLLSTFSGPEVGIYEMGEGALSFLNSTLSVLTIGINLLLVIVLWAVLAFDKNNWRTFMDKIALLGHSGK